MGHVDFGGRIVTTHVRRWGAFCAALGVWLASFGHLAVVARSVGLSFHFNVEVLWRVFGVPDNLYGFRNVVVPDIITHLIIATPSAILAMWTYELLSTCRQAGGAGGRVVIVATIGYFIAGAVIAYTAGGRAAMSGVGAVMLVVLTLTFVVLLLWSLRRCFATTPPGGG